MFDFKHIRIAMVGENGNAFSIMGRVQKAMKKEGCTPEEVTEVLDVMKEGDYNHLLNAVMDIFSIDGEDDEDEDCS